MHFYEDENNPLIGKQEENKENKQTKVYPQHCNGCMKSTKFFCNSCKNVVYSKVSIETTKETWFAVIIMCFFPVGGFCFIPLMIDYMKDYVHTCPLCELPVGRREYQIAKPLKILMLVVAAIVLILLIILIILSIFMGNAVWKEFKKAQQFRNEIENGEGE